MYSLESNQGNILEINIRNWYSDFEAILQDCCRIHGSHFANSGVFVYQTTSQ